MSKLAFRASSAWFGSLLAMLAACTVQNAALADEKNEWQLFRPIGGYFSVRVPKLVPQTDLPSLYGAKLRLWAIHSGDKSYRVVAMYSPNADFKDLIEDPSKFEKHTVNGVIFEGRTSPKTKEDLPTRTLFHCSKNHAVMISESAPTLPSLDDEFFQSIQIEDNRVVPMKKINDTKYKLSFLMPADCQAEDGYWTGQDTNNDYTVGIDAVTKTSESEQLAEMEEFADAFGKNRVDDKITKVQGCNAREFRHGDGKFMIIIAPPWSYTFSCIGADTSQSTLKARDDFFSNIFITSQ